MDGLLVAVGSLWLNRTPLLTATVAAAAIPATPEEDDDEMILPLLG
jgi:hypothetical protein